MKSCNGSEWSRLSPDTVKENRLHKDFKHTTHSADGLNEWIKFGLNYVLIICFFSSQLDNLQRAVVGRCCPRLETERRNHGELQQWQTLVPVPFYLPYTPWNHLMHVLLLSLVNHNWGRGGSLLHSPSLHNMQAAALKKKRQAKRLLISLYV